MGGDFSFETSRFPFLAGFGELAQFQFNEHLRGMFFATDDHMDSLVGCFAMGQSPGEFVHGFMGEDGSSNNPVLGSTELNQPLSIIILRSTSMCTLDSIVVGVTGPNFGFEIINCEEQVMLWDLGNNRLELLTPVIVNFRIGSIGWCIALQDCEIAVLRIEACYD